MSSTETYRLGRRLKAGSTGEVYEVQHPWLRGRFVMKMLRPTLAMVPEATRAYRDELTKVAAVRHPNIAEIIEVGTMPDGPPFVVLERLDGRTLAERLTESPIALPVDEVLSLVRLIAGALQAAHGRGVTHGELNPRNIYMVAADGYEYGFPKLLDFGISRLRSGSASDLSVSADIARYLSPEQARGGQAEIDGRTDQFALAAIAYRMLTGGDAFKGDDPISVLYQVVHEPPPLAANGALDARLIAVLKRGLAKQPTERFETVMAFTQALEEATRIGRVDERAAVRSPHGRQAPNSFPADYAAHGGPPRTRGDTIKLDASTSSARLPVQRGARRGVRGGVLLDDSIEAPVLTDHDLERIPIQHRWRLPAFVLLVGVATFFTAMWAGWRPPEPMRQSSVWHALHLPYAVTPGQSAPATASAEPAAAAEAHPGEPRPYQPTVVAEPIPGAATGAGPGGEAAAGSPSAPGNAPVVGSEPAGGSAPTVGRAPAAGSAPGGGSAPEGEAVPAPEGAAVAAPVAGGGAPAAGSAPVAGTAPAPANPTGAGTARPPGATPVAAKTSPAANPSDPTAAAAGSKTKPSKVALKGLVWSDKEQRLVPADSASAPPSPSPQSAPPTAGPPPPTSTTVPGLSPPPTTALPPLRPRTALPPPPLPPLPGAP